MIKIKDLKSSQPILGQLLSYIPRELFKDSVEFYKSDKWYKKVKTWDQFVFMFYGVLTGSSSLREIVKNFGFLREKLVHCGLFRIPRRSSISDANSNRKADVFGYLYLRLYHHYRSYFSDSFLSIRINNEVLPKDVEIFDSTVITLFKDIFKACGRLPKDGRRKGGLKSFVKITLGERIPNFICLKSAATNEKVFLSFLDLPRGTIAVFDKGFQKFKQYAEWTANGIFFITRMNKNAKFKILRQRPLAEACQTGVQMDAEIELEYKSNNDIKTTKARMVAYIDPATNKKLIFLTNQFTLKALTICMLYKSRWTIEPLFKQIKQNFELNMFLSNSQEGIKTQIWVAMILNLIFTVLHQKIKEAEDFATMVKLAAKNTSSYVSLEKFLKLSEELLMEFFQDLENIQLDLFNTINGAKFNDSS